LYRPPSRQEFSDFRAAVGRLEDSLDELISDPGQRRFVHSSAGMELGAFVVTAAMTDPRTRYALYYRCHAWLIGLGAAPEEVIAAVRAGAPISPMQPVIRRLPVRFISVTVGAQLPFALGLALAGQGPVVVSLGDGALSTGVTAETLNCAALRRPDLLFVVDDNNRVVDQPGESVLASSAAALAAAYGLPCRELAAADGPSLRAAARWIRDTAGAARVLHVRSSGPAPHCLAFGGG
jgi:TPP-dependent pyruvate/acetoin dehydrogenase alpha subunit